MLEERNESQADSIFTIPIIVNFSLAFFNPDGGQIGLQFDKALEVSAMVLLPVILGMIANRLWPRIARRLDKPVRVASLVILALVIAAAVLSNLQQFLASVGPLIAIATLVCVISLSVGFFVPRLFRVGRPQAISSALEIGLHNGAVALVIAMSLLNSPTMALPAAIYGSVSIVLGFLAAVAFRMVTKRADARNGTTTPASAEVA